VVGDDKQVSPSDVGLKETDIQALSHRFLSGLPYGAHLLPGASIYDLGSTMFASDVIRLREHFRCVQSIIEFSNRQFYDHEIKPLRVPKPALLNSEWVNAPHVG
jgi:superfamily I DNA and/or RNA helicase